MAGGGDFQRGRNWEDVCIGWCVGVSDDFLMNVLKVLVLQISYLFG